ncbi:hypothetical protein DFJ58DRAFT_131691 [Suillus subalutaceus]|uniref:uncharacterized protein n=1 Tax=Suillus subalutaceus TaxID=48586 RepID=UPI001B87B577|nr:uncharacterized protein DFJ58DRAFT_131691 [Suillus subalutaceus]KAG1838271.1 hypothetical protein DFJ58DRAFT_131691 [Suillus subalutaceus]
MRTSALLTLFFSFFFVIEMAFCMPLSMPAWVQVYAPDTRDILGSQNKRIMDPVTGPIGMSLRKLGRPALREMQLQIDDYCSKFPCPAPRGTSEI